MINLRCLQLSFVKELSLEPISKDLQRKLTLDFGRAFLVGRIYFDQYQQGHSGKYYPNGAMVILKDQQGKVIPTQNLDGDKKLTQHGHTDLRYNLSLKPADYSQTMNAINAAKDDAVNKVNQRQNQANFACLACRAQG